MSRKTLLFTMSLTAAGVKHGHQLSGWSGSSTARTRRIAKKLARNFGGRRTKPSHYRLEIEAKGE